MIFNMTGGGGTMKSRIVVTAPTGSVVTCSNTAGDLKTATEKNGTWTFVNCDIGTWTVTATLGSETASETVVIQEEGQLLRYEVTIAYVKIYGIQRDITQSSPEWVRTDDAVGLTAVASVGTQAGHSSFDNCYPWNGIVRETLSTGDVMVKIPRFWYKRWRDGNVEHIQIADKIIEGKTDDFILHPAFNISGEKNSLYIAAYKTSAGHRSVAGVNPPLRNVAMRDFRSNAAAKGSGWYQWNVEALSAVQFLFLVEFATNDIQSALGRGNVDDAAYATTGSCDGVPNLTGRPEGTDGTVSTVYRGIEDLYSNLWTYTEGILNNKGTTYYCADPSKYADSSTNYTKFDYNIPTASSANKSYIKTVSLVSGLEHLMLPQTVGGSSSTMYCDALQCDAEDLNVFRTGGTIDTGSISGIFGTSIETTYRDGTSGSGSRLMYIPQEVSA